METGIENLGKVACKLGLSAKEAVESLLKLYDNMAKAATDGKIIAVDFDGTLCENKWPDIGAPNNYLIDYLKNQQKHGSKIILWTCRAGDRLTKAVDWCEEHGLIFDAVNDNLPEAIQCFGGDSRKIFAHEYIDDHMCTKFKLPFKQGG